MLKLLVPLLVLLAVALGLTALDRSGPRADFTFINRGDVSTLDPAIVSWMQDNRVLRIIGEGLTRSDIFTDNFELEPAAAERWEVSEDRRTYTFHIRKDAKWSNGDDVRASDWIYSWRRSMMPDLAGDYIKLYELIEGGKDFIEWRSQAIAGFAPKAAAMQTDAERNAAAEALWQESLAKFDSLVQVKAIDDKTLRVTLVRPTTYFLDLLGFPPMFPVYPPLVAAYESIDPRTGMLKSRPDWTKPPLTITNGPFKLTAWRFKRDMRFEQNPHYWNRANLNLRSIAITSVQDPNASVLAFRTGAVDWVSDVVPTYRMEMLREKRAFYAEHSSAIATLQAEGIDPIEIDRRLPSDPRNTIHVFPAFGTYFYNFNCSPSLADGRPNPLADRKVRKALALAMNKKAVTENIRQVGEPVANTIVPRGALVGYTSPAGLEQNIDQARQLLVEAGFKDGVGLSVEILFNKDGGHDLIAQAIAKDWERDLGIEVRLAQTETKTFRERLKNGDYMISRAAWFGDYGDPTTFLTLNRTGDGNNDRKYSNPEYDALLDAAEEAPTPEARLAMLSRAEQIIVEEDLPLAPIFQYVQLYLFNPHRLTGISSHPRMEQHMHRIDVLGDGIGAEVPLVMRKGKEREGGFRLKSPEE